jgi:hypothetical protein
LFRIYGGTSFPIDTLHQSIALGVERTMQQDPAFALRIIVDIAAKGLSPAINDPTTAVLAIDQIHHLLRHIGNRRLDNEQVRDAAGRVRLLYRTPDWEDFVTLAVTSSAAGRALLGRNSLRTGASRHGLHGLNVGLVVSRGRVRARRKGRSNPPVYEHQGRLGARPLK